ncbi:MAG: hypothetical protein ACU84J_08335 [Gammaproteobacteria bacterium]
MTTFESLVREKQHIKNGISMKQNQNTEKNDGMREEYDFSSMKGGVKGKYASAFENSAVTVLLDSDVAKIFPDSQAVNEALRTLARVLQNREKNVQENAPADVRNSHR